MFSIHFRKYIWNANSATKQYSIIMKTCIKMRKFKNIEVKFIHHRKHLKPLDRRCGNSMTWITNQTSGLAYAVLVIGEYNEFQHICAVRLTTNLEKRVCIFYRLYLLCLDKLNNNAILSIIFKFIHIRSLWDHSAVWTLIVLKI